MIDGDYGLVGALSYMMSTKSGLAMGLISILAGC